MKHILLTAVAAAALLGCEQAEQLASDARDRVEERHDVDTAHAPAPEIGTWGFDLTGMDPTVNPGDDFERYASGAWLDREEIPGDRSRWGVFDELRERSTQQVRAIIEELQAGEAAAGSLEQKVRDYYANWMDVEAIEAAGLAPLAPHLEAIAAIEDRAGLMAAFSSLHNTAPFGVGIIPDPADTTRYTAFLAQGGIGMPDRDYYLSEEERFVEFRAAYRDYVVRIHELAGVVDSEAKADAIIALETQIAEAHWSTADSRDIQKIYNPTPVDQLAADAPQIDWAGILGEIGLGDIPVLVVAQPSAIQAAGELLDSTPLETWKDYLAYHFIRSHAAYLPEAFDRANFDFFSKTLRGIEEQRERAKRGADLVNANLGEAVGQIYVDRHFPPESKAQMDTLVVNLRAALGALLESNAWMDDETRAEALAKLATFEPRIGYTEQWTDYTPLEIMSGDLLGDSLRVTEFQWQEQVRRLDGPVDRLQWPYPPQTVNASYNPLLNQITFPAGILQPPFFDPNADPAINYGAIGAVIGHEIGHGFDDQGRRFDQNGLIRDWWSEDSSARFTERSDRLVAQYDEFAPLPDMNINGSLSLGENIGDLGGVEMAYAAYRRHVAEHGEPPVLDGFTGDQRFFLSWAQVWRSLYREDALRQQLVTGPHSPARYRVLGPLRNVDAWYAAFDVTEEDEMYLPPDERVSIWAVSE